MLPIVIIAHNCLNLTPSLQTKHLDNGMLHVWRPDKDDLLHIRDIDSQEHPKNNAVTLPLLTGAPVCGKEKAIFLLPGNQDNIVRGIE